MEELVKKLEKHINMRLQGIAVLNTIYTSGVINGAYTEDAYKKGTERLRLDNGGLNTILYALQNNKTVEIYHDFAFLSKTLLEAGFSDKECVDFIIYMLKQNLKQGEKCAKEGIDGKLLLEFDFKTMPKEKVRELVKNKRIIDLINFTYEKLEPGEKKFIVELHENLDKFLIDCDPYREKYNFILKHYEEMSCVDDVEFIIDGLKDIKVTDELIDFVRKYLYKKARRAQFKPVKPEVVVEQPKEEPKKEVKKVESQVITKKDTAKYHKKPEYLTEQDVRDLKKFIKKYYDLYNVTLFETPDYENLLKCLDAMEKLETDKYQVRRFLEDNFKTILKDDEYIKTYDELIMLLHYLVKYEVEDKKTDSLITKYRSLKEHFENPVAEAIHYIDEFAYYDQVLGNELREYLEQIFIPNEEGYETIKGMIEAYIEDFKEYQERLDYEKQLAKNIKSR
ncbi:MAG: hypothetical protein J1F35_00315 [Erysipelotrichales bacterium]|nr:hypothetical protein [Erysipelotrichales bacterium]